MPLPKTKPAITSLPIEQRDTAYRLQLERQSLHLEDAEDLIRRGVNADQINTMGVKTLHSKKHRSGFQASAVTRTSKTRVISSRPLTVMGASLVVRFDPVVGNTNGCRSATSKVMNCRCRS